jgi:diguanylate cyclase (GGDEF)-like protein
VSGLDTTDESSLELLSRSPLFRGVDEGELNAITAFMDRRLVIKGKAVFCRGEVGEELFILVSGALAGYAIRDDGSRHQLFTVEKGSFFGERAVINRSRRTTTVVATEDSDLLVLHGIDFYRILYEYPGIGAKLLKAMGEVQAGWLERDARHLNDLLRWGEAARRRAITDDLTGLNNRRFLEDSLEERFRQGAVGLRKLSLLMMDLDRVHEINERCGVPAGDRVICAAAAVIRSQVRTGDIPARLSGDEFAVLLPDTGSGQAGVLAERIRAGVNLQELELQPLSGGEPFLLRIGVSIGIASAPAHADSGEGLVSAADAALQRAKNLGRNRVETAGAEAVINSE